MIRNPDRRYKDDPLPEPVDGYAVRQNPSPDLRWYVTGPDGRQVSGLFCSSDDCLTARDRIARRAKLTHRRCMTCGEEFQSQGAHNRMCTACRARGDAGSPYSMAVGSGLSSGSRGSRRPRAS